MSTTVGAHQWRGLIEEYRDRLPVSDRTPIVSLRCSIRFHSPWWK